VLDSIGGGLPILRQAAADDGPEALLALDLAIARALPLLPARVEAVAP